MSRLAAVHTGQPTQGVGTAPNGKSKPASAPELNTMPLTVDDLDAQLQAQSATVNPRDPYSAVRAAATAAWLSLSATELEVRQHFRTIPVQSGLETLAKMRRQCDLAAETLQGRMNESNTERCTGCGKTLEEVRKTQWLMVGSDVDPDTGVPKPYRFCGPMCIRERNREKMLPRELRDQKRVDGEDIAEVR
jgi:hypothetical protein